jgi:hypothetical protein
MTSNQLALSNRSEIIRRCHPKNDGDRRRRRRRRQSRLSPLYCQLLLTLHPLLHTMPPYYYANHAAAAYLGPTHCIKPGTSAASVLTSSASSSTSTTTITKMGYSTYNHLLFDLISLSNDFQSGQSIPEERLTFTLCPNKVIDLDDSTLPLGYLPIDVPRTTIQCGGDGSRSNNCIIRGGGKRNSQSTNWNTNREYAYKNNEFGILGGGEDNVAQIYVYGESAYEVTLKGLTMDNSITENEMRLYQEYVAHFGGGGSGGGSNGGGAGNVNSNGGKRRRTMDGTTVIERNTQVDDIEAGLTAAGSEGGGRSGSVQPAHRLTSIAVRGKGYGHDAGPRLITIEDCKFTYHRGYAILVSPGIQGPDLPIAPEFKNPQSSSSASASSSTESQSGQSSIVNEPVEGSGGSGSRTTKQRSLNLLDDGAKYIPADGQVSYYDQTDENRKSLDGHRVKIINSEFVNNISSDNVAGLITSAYSLTVSNCLFERNSARAVVFVYNHEAAVENTMFVENFVEISTVIMQTPKGQGSKTTSFKNGANVNNTTAAAATIISTMDAAHIVKRSCFLGSHVGMSNVLVTDATDSGFTQRDNHARGTEYTWASKCEDGAAEKVGNDCMTNANCIGKCVPFTSEECVADRAVTSEEFELFMNDGFTFCQHGRSWWRTSLGAMLVLFPLISFA